MPSKTMDMQFPAAGVMRRSGLSAAANGRGPYPASWSTNVRLEDALTTRLRGGSFVAQAAIEKVDPVYRNRAITFAGKAITAARQGDSTDTSMSADISDVGRPILFQLSEAGETGGDVVAVVPHKDSNLLCFTASETWVLSGDPATGSLRRVSDEVGIIGASAFCVSHDMVYFLSSLGLYSVAADGSGLKPISEDKIPVELSGVTDATTVLDYKHSDRGVYIHIPAAAVSWFYDTARDGFWPFNRSVTDSHALIGPFRLGQPNSFGRVLNIQGNIATGSADVSWRLVTNDTAEKAASDGKAAIEAAVAGSSYSVYVDAEGSWSAGRSNMDYPRTRAVFCCLWLHSTGVWAYETSSLVATLSGKWR